MAIPKLVILSEQLRGQAYELTRELYSIGRGEKESICIPDPTVSGRHCDLVRNEDGTYSARDLGSTNGTRINGVRITEQKLMNSDILQIGGIEIMFDCEDQSTTSAVATQTGINLEETAGGMAVEDMGNFSPFSGKNKKGADNPKVKMIVTGVIVLLAVVVGFLGFLLAKNMAG
jgi:pSer/pThr/pTyr-binding forkhead associated (FHA) protein